MKMFIKDYNRIYKKMYTSFVRFFGMHFAVRFMGLSHYHWSVYILYSCKIFGNNTLGGCFCSCYILRLLVGENITQ